MTGTSLIPLPTFEGREIRGTEKDGQVWISIHDLSLALGLDRSTLAKHIERDSDLYAFTHISVDNLSTVPLRCVNEEGLYLLLGAISTSRLKPEIRTAIREFRKWTVPKLLKQFRKGEIVQTTDIKAELEQARHYAGLTQGDPRHFQAAVFKKHNMPEYAEALLQSTPVPVQGDTGGWFNPSQLVQFCNDPMLTAERLNHYLANNPKDPDRRPFQFKEGYIWRLTPLGMEHGKEYVYTAPSQHQEIRIAWRKSVLAAVGLVKE
jgi:prophage antirepressor-like protein